MVLFSIFRSFYVLVITDLSWVNARSVRLTVRGRFMVMSMNVEGSDGVKDMTHEAKAKAMTCKAK